MTTVTIEKASNGYVVKCGDAVYVAESIRGYSGISLVDVLNDIFNPKPDYKVVDPEVVEVAA